MLSRSGVVRKIKPVAQHRMLTIIDGKNVEVPIFSYTRKLSDTLLNKIAVGSMRIEKYYRKPMDIEFAVHQNKIYFLQARPITI